ncbi:hypothetical protein BIY24_04870 [Halobacteriovorax marinus]|uniref:hypothetical protein n=1 Tax=Halobacteriovorax marinus TaxID=97084 RepID=UPI000BC2D0A9|nr:hypothetical protein [Halobacteriovorax marinus]ATH07291.1 hypothetical protein BIY24_04870 [Halobacteriovorax marinus]
MLEQRNILETLLRFSAFFVLIGRGIQHLFFDVPIRILLWNESLLSPLFNLFGWSWRSYVTSPLTDFLINLFVILIGCFLCICSLFAIFNLRKGEKLLLLSGVYLVFLSAIYMSAKFFIPAQFIEYSAQMFSPFALFLYWRRGESERLILFIRIAVALTFIGHGAYALGIFPVPGNFIDMVINILGCDESFARNFLKVMGSLDFLAAILLFIPMLSHWALGFCAMWGVLTSLARVSEDSVFGVSHILSSMGHEFIMRGPHFILPVVLIYCAHKKSLQRVKAFHIN